ncbi:hypothetical protein EYM_03095 [Ignicoccus islandicus DSM 13165]|uniref:SAM-dependent chlorinase/fluorinase n=1 Tax=Ignicoccus islandicus DSM 13165 TaxID=940295 RepID=A0A0U2VEE6_9CREN|nr:SAM-dependent chlorinase/fluorinase [Ignicoccus islandicus]ALU12386.1 hypothetical protein EYM_03095 [Ignicoccus islandicus DSM 13165]
MIGIITDYGYNDVYAGLLKVVAKEVCRNAEIIDITHGIESFNILKGAYATLVTLPHLPPRSSLVVVVDPSVGSSREPIVAEIGEWYVVAPNNGVVWLAALEYGVGNVFRIEKKLTKYRSHTFHGRDIFVPVGAYLECGGSPERLGNLTSLKELPVNLVRELSGSMLRSTVIYVDKFGNVALWYKGNPFSYGDKVLINNKFEAKVVKTFSEVRKGELAVYVNSFGYLEIAKYLGNAARELDLEEGNIVTLEKLT